MDKHKGPFIPNWIHVNTKRGLGPFTLVTEDSDTFTLPTRSVAHSLHRSRDVLLCGLYLLGSFSRLCISKNLTICKFIFHLLKCSDNIMFFKCLCTRFLTLVLGLWSILCVCISLCTHDTYFKSWTSADVKRSYSSNPQIICCCRCCVHAILLFCLARLQLISSLCTFKIHRLGLSVHCGR